MMGPKLCVGIGDGHLIPPLMTESLFHGHINPYWVDEFIPYFLEIMGV